MALLMSLVYICCSDISLAADSPPTAATITKPEYSVVEKLTVDEKAVFATVESANVVPARARIGGTIVELKIKQGDRVERDQVIATVGDQKIGLQIQSLEAQARAAQAEVDQTRLDLDRAEKLVQQGYATKARVEQLRTAHNVAINNLKSQTAQQSVVQQQQTEGKILAPTAGRVLTVPITAGTVIMAGEPVATIAEQNYILRLSVPERHAAFIKAGDAIRVDGSDLGLSATQSGTIKLIYPKIENGRLQADAVLNGVGDYFVGERVRVWVSTGTRKALAIPGDYITTQNGIDFIQLKQSDSTVIEVPVQRGHVLTLPDLPVSIEILSGLKVGDTLVHP
ncbi:MAG: efflux RND transporter periplasmic adaptor subunit [Alphaproteobacteria bacterium]|nr:efflux RND transporter periplasmic adaptor subunit [Alphaproteobacteria bacterium]